MALKQCVRLSLSCCALPCRAVLCRRDPVCPGSARRASLGADEARQLGGRRLVRYIVVSCRPFSFQPIPELASSKRSLFLISCRFIRQCPPPKCGIVARYVSVLRVARAAGSLLCGVLCWHGVSCVGIAPAAAAAAAAGRPVCSRRASPAPTCSRSPASTSVHIHIATLRMST